MTDDTTTGVFDLASTHIHLGLGARAIPLPGFEWSDEYLAGYAARFASDGDEGRLVTMGPVTASWDAALADYDHIVANNSLGTFLVNVSGCSSPSTRCRICHTARLSASASSNRPSPCNTEARLLRLVNVSRCSSPRSAAVRARA